jgi:DNA-binding CsgD family transcriptional regulator
MSATLHEKRCLDVLHATSVKDFTRQIVSFVQDLGFSTFGAMVVTEHSPTLHEFHTVNNAPEAYLETFRDRRSTVIDPVLQHCKHSSSPFVWDRRHYSGPHMRTLWDEQEPFGYRSGLAVGMHFARGRHFAFGANWARDRCGDAPHFKAIAEDLLSFAEHAQAAAFELTLPAKHDPDNAWSLARTELEALRWTMDGMTSWQVAGRMSMSERHVTLLLRRAMQKLGCSSKYETGLRAIRLGLIECS